LIYLDNNATTPVDPAVRDSMIPYLSELFGNAGSRTHAIGWRAAKAVDKAREQVARLINASSSEIIFTSGATEAINLALQGTHFATRDSRQHIITVQTEHKAVLETCKFLEGQGATVTNLGVDRLGLINLQQLEAAITQNTRLISVMYANNETGVVQPIRKIAAIARKYGVLVMSDATQAVGKMSVDVNADDIDLLTFSAHKIYGPKGIGALFIKKKTPKIALRPMTYGGGEEKGLRAGTLAVPNIVGFGKACELCSQNPEEERQRMELLRDKLETELLSLGNALTNGDTRHRTPTVCNIAFGGLPANMLMECLQEKIAFSTGSACSSVSAAPSHVLKAMELSPESIRGSVRLSVGRFTTMREIEDATSQIKEMIARLR